MPISDTITQQLNSLEGFAKNAPNYYLQLSCWPGWPFLLR
jgi:hypothetical protein